MRLDFLFAAVIVSLNSVRLPLGVSTLPTAFCVNAVNAVGALGDPTAVTRPFTWVVATLKLPLLNADAALTK